ncbi:MAG: hypothetical protein ACRCXZ_03735, partial [Patescibacteria group bacterium]
MNQKTNDKLSELLISLKLKLGSKNSNLPIKKFFINNILSNSRFDFDSELLYDNAFSVRAFKSLNIAIESEIEFLPVENKEVILHPFTPHEIVEMFNKQGFSIQSSPIDTKTLIFDIEILKSKLDNINPSIVVIYSLNQFYNEYVETIKNYPNTNFIFIDDSKLFNNEFYKLINSAQDNCLIIKFTNNSVIDYALNQSIKLNPQINKMFYVIDINKDLLYHKLTMTELNLTEEVLDALAFVFDQYFKQSILNKVKNNV